MEPQFNDLRKEYGLDVHKERPRYLGGTAKVDLWLLTPRSAPHAVLACQYAYHDTYVSYTPPHTAALDALGQYDEEVAREWLGKNIKTVPADVCVRWGAEDHEDHNIKEIARYMAIFAPDCFPQDLREQLLRLREDPNNGESNE